MDIMADFTIDKARSFFEMYYVKFTMSEIKKIGINKYELLVIIDAINFRTLKELEKKGFELGYIKNMNGKTYLGIYYQYLVVNSNMFKTLLDFR
jgi:hypothetical protein